MVINLYIRVTYDQEFDDIMMYFRSKYTEELFNLEGIGEQLDLAKFSKTFFSKKTVADASIDQNSNVDDISIISYTSELKKPFEKINSYYMLWRELKRLYGLQAANEILEMQLTGDIYIHDFHGVGAGQPYCFNYSTYDIMTQGLPMVQKVTSLPPKYLYAFKSQIEQFVVIASNSTLGATGLADILIMIAMYAENILKTKSDAHFKFQTEEDCWTYVKENLGSMVYTINQPMRSNQSPFTNLGVYDKYFLEKLCSDYIHPLTGEKPKIKIVQKIQEIFLDLMNEELSRTPLTFPIVTACFSIDDDKKIKDKKFLKLIAEKNIDYGFINIYCGKISTLSSCCFKGSQKTLTKSSKGVSNLTFEELYNSSWKDTKQNYRIFHNGSWVSGKIIKLPIKNKLYKITTINNKEIVVTKDHLHPTINGDKKTDKLTTSDYLMFNTMPLEKSTEDNLKLTYEQGVLIGSYLGDGSIYKNQINFSLNENKYEKLLPILKKALKQWNIDEDIHLNTPYNNVYPVAIYSNKLKDKIKKWVKGNYGHEKEINLNCLLHELDFRKGIIDGIYATDGGNSNRIYTTSSRLAEHLEIILNSLGISSIINITDRTDEEVVIRGEIFKRNYPLYCIRWYSPKTKRNMRDVYKIKNNSMYFKIKSIEEKENKDEFVYCFEMKNIDEPYFTLPNGIITHNCRLRSESDNEYYNLFGSGSSKIGSIGVCSINLPRLAFKYKDNEEKFFETLENMVSVCAKVNNVKRKIIKKRIDNGNHPLYYYGFINLQAQYSTVGVNGFNECIETMGHNILEDDGVEFGLKIIGTINRLNKRFQSQHKYPHNVEQVPGESMSIKMAEKDKLLGYQDTYEIYSNQFIPLTINADMLDRIRLQGIFDSHFSGGAICHINVEERISDPKDIEDLIVLCAKMGVIYWAINYNLQRCEDGHLAIGKKDTCSICNKKIIDNFTRVVGFLTNVKNWPEYRRKNDYPNRQFYKGVGS